MCGGASSIFQASWSALISLQYLDLSHLLSPTLLTKVSCRLIGTFIRGQPLSSSFLGSRNIFPRNPHFSSCAQDAPEIRTHLLLLVGSFSLPLVRLIKSSTMSHFLRRPVNGILRIGQLALMIWMSTDVALQLKPCLHWCLDFFTIN